MKGERAVEMPRGPKRNDVTVKIAADVYRKAKLVAAYHDTVLAEYLSDLLRKPVDRDFQKVKQLMVENGQGDASDGE